MNILVCTDIFRNGGLETHIITFAKHFRENGHKIFLSTDGLSRGYLQSYKSIFKDILFLQDSFNWDWADFVNISEKIADYIIKNKIDAVICHPFGAFVYAVHACIKTNCPYFPVFHGPASVNPSYPLYFKEFYDLWLEHITLPKAAHSFAVSNETIELLKSKANSIASKTSLLLNPVTVFSKPKLSNSKQEYIFFASRIDNDKYNSIISSILFFEEKIVPEFPNLKLYIAGEGSKLDDLARFILEKNLKEKVRLLGFMSYPEMMSMISNAKLIIGMGRVCLEAIILKKRVILAGYDGLKDLVTISNIKSYGKNNFSGRGVKNSRMNSLYLKIQPILIEKKDSEFLKLYKYVNDNYGVSIVGDNLIKIMNNVLKLKVKFYTDTDLAEEEILFSFCELNKKMIESKKIKNDIIDTREKLLLKEAEIKNIKDSKSWKIVMRIRQIVKFFRN